MSSRPGRTTVSNFWSEKVLRSPPNQVYAIKAILDLTATNKPTSGDCLSKQIERGEKLKITQNAPHKGEGGMASSSNAGIQET